MVRDTMWSNGTLGKDAGSTTVAVLVGVALVASAGIAIAVDDPAQPAQAANSDADRTDDTETPEAVDVEWTGALPTEACTPTSPNGCSGATLGDGDDRYDTRVAQNVSQAHLEVTWDPFSPATERLTVTLASGYEENCSSTDTCFYWRALVTETGGPGMAIDASDLEIQDDHTLWLLVDAPQPTEELHYDAHNRQTFEVTGEIQPSDPTAATTSGGR